MSHANFSSPREAARAFTPKLTKFVDSTLYPQVWSDPALSPRDRSLVTVSALITGGHLEELPADLLRAVDIGVTRDELAAASLIWCSTRVFRCDLGVRRRTGYAQQTRGILIIKAIIFKDFGNATVLKLDDVPMNMNL
jgi:4-carboxymuconolactone decarboxylase